MVFTNSPIGLTSGLCNTVYSGKVSADSSDSIVTGYDTASLNSYIPITITLKNIWRNPKSGVAAVYITLSATATETITQPALATDANGQTIGRIKRSDIGNKTVEATISTGTLVQNDGSTPDADGKLNDTHIVSVEDNPRKIKLLSARKKRKPGLSSFIRDGGRQRNNILRQ